LTGCKITSRQYSAAKLFVIVGLVRCYAVAEFSMQLYCSTFSVLMVQRLPVNSDSWLLSWTVAHTNAHAHGKSINGSIPVTW